jgi:hypothetical protein
MKPKSAAIRFNRGATSGERRRLETERRACVSWRRLKPFTSPPELIPISPAREVLNLVLVGENSNKDENVRSDVVKGQLVFDPANLSAAQFNFHPYPRRVEIDISAVPMWDLTRLATWKRSWSSNVKSA